MNSIQTQKYPCDFWHWFFKNRYRDFEHLRDGQTIVAGAKNPFNYPLTYDMRINFETGMCTDSEGINFRMLEYIALLEEKDLKETGLSLEVEYENWRIEKREETAHTPFQRDLEQYQWKMKRGDDLKVITTFDVRLDAVIEKYDIKRQQWERTFQGEIRGLKGDTLVRKPFSFEPQQTHTAKNFSEAVWEKDFFQVKMSKNEKVRQFWTFLDEYFTPRIVREYNHYGFITFQGEPFFLSGNALVRFPKEKGEKLQLISKKDEAFQVDDNKYLRPPEEAFNLPHFELGVSDPDRNRFQEAEFALLGNAHFEQKLQDVEQHLCGMIGGENEFRRWGQLIIGYVFSFLFFDEIYDLYQHGIFLYLYGEGNVGKGELAKRVLDFFGISYLDSQNNPPARTVDQELELKSKIPLWIDEFVPELNGRDANIKDQTWNSWFELKIRQTNMQTKKAGWKKERKKVRTVPLFCSNFKPQTDHLLSRCLMLEYRKSVRGPERHVRWLKQNKKLLQLLMLSFLQHYQRMDRNMFSWNLDLLRTVLRDQVKQELENRIEDVILQDRQITQFAVLFTVYHWMFADYREKITEIYAKKRNLSKTDDVAFKKERLETIKTEILDLTDQELFDFVKGQIIQRAVAVARYDPLTEYIETIGSLIQRGKITKQHFNWMKNGTLKIYAKAVWDIYEAEKRGTDSLVRKEIVENKLKELSELSKDGSLKAVSWTVSGDGLDGETITQRGFYITNAVEKELLRRTFNWEKYKPSGAMSYQEKPSEGESEDLPF